MLTKHTAPPTPEEVAAAEVVLAGLGPNARAAVTTVVRAEVRPVVRRIGRELAAWLLAITVVLTAGMFAVENTADRVQRESVERQVNACESANEFRTFLRDDYARRGRPLNVEAIRSAPEYLALPADVRPFVDALIQALADQRAQAAEQGEDYSEQFPIIDCAALERSLR